MSVDNDAAYLISLPSCGVSAPTLSGVFAPTMSGVFVPTLSSCMFLKNCPELTDRVKLA